VGWTDEFRAQQERGNVSTAASITEGITAEQREAEPATEDPRNEHCKLCRPDNKARHAESARVEGEEQATMVFRTRSQEVERKIKIQGREW
jgi:hypothetical protein